MLGDHDFGILAQGVFDHLQLFEGLSIAHKVFLGSFIDQPDGLGLALSHVNRRFAFPLRPLNDRLQNFSSTRRATPAHAWVVPAARFARTQPNDVVYLLRLELCKRSVMNRESARAG